jgi:hypothetical protein
MQLLRILLALLPSLLTFIPAHSQTDNRKREGDMADPAINPVYKYYEWKNEIPANCPFERSKDINKVIFSGRYANYTGADTWYFQSAADGHMYSCWTDGSIEGFSCNSNIRALSTGQAKVVGSHPLNLKVENLGRLYSGPNHYPCVSLIANGVFYIGTYNAFNDQGYFRGFRYSTDWDHFTDNTEPGWKNQYWQDASAADDNFFDEQGKAKFRTPHAVNFARNNVGPDGKIYLSAHGYSSGKGRNNWDKGDAIYLCRVDARPEAVTNPAAYEFFAGHDKQGKAVWKKKVEESKPIADWPNHLGSESITYFKAINKYILMTARLKEEEENLDHNNFIVLEADQITGPYKMVHYMKDWGVQTYFPNIPTQLIGEDGQTAWLTVAANYNAANFNPHQSRYAASMHEIILDVKGRRLPEPPAMGTNIAPQAKITSTSAEPDSPAAAAVDGTIDREAKKPAHEWISQEGGGGMIKFEWQEPRNIHAIRVYDSPAADRWTQEGFFTFSDGSMEWMYAAPANSAGTPAEISFPAKKVKWVKFTITKGIAEVTKTTTVEPGQRLGVAEIEIFEK